MKRAMIVALVLAVLALPVFNVAAQAAEYKVGFCVMTLAFTWMTYSYQALLDEAAKYPEIELIVDNANGDVSRQVEIIENFIAQGVDAIITDPLDVNTLIPVMEDAAAKGIVFCTFDRSATGGPYLFHVGCDDVFGGRLALEYCAAKLDGVGNIVHIVGQLGASPAINRQKGIHEQLVYYPGLELVYEQSGQFSREEGLRVMEDAITATGGDFDAVICANDDSALGAIQAMKDAGIDLNDVIVVGYDGVPDGLRAILAGELNASIQYPVQMAGLVMKQVADYLKDGTMPEATYFDMNPWMLIKDNLEEWADFWPELE